MSKIPLPTEPSPVQESYWQREAAWGDHHQVGPIPSEADFAIIGGGYSGLATAIQLRELNPDASIVLLEAERVGFGASGRNAGFLSPVAAPIWLLGADRSEDQAWGVGHLNEEMRRCAEWIKGHLFDAQLREASLCIEGGGWLTNSGLHEFSRALDHGGVKHRVSTSRVHPKRLFVEMDAYTVHPYRLARALADHARESGVAIHERSRILGIDSAAGGARLRLDDGSSLLAGTAIVCTNGYTPSLDAGESMRAMVVHSFMVASEPLDEEAQRSMIRDADFTVELNSAQPYHRHHNNRLLYGGIDKFVAHRGGEFAVPQAVQTRLEKHMRHSFPNAQAIPVRDAWSGRFHSTPTGLPIIRRSAKNPALLFNVGYGGTGVLLTQVCAPLVAALASRSEFARPCDEKLFQLIQDTRLSVPSALRAVGRVVRGLANPWLGGRSSRTTDKEF